MNLNNFIFYTLNVNFSFTFNFSHANSDIDLDFHYDVNLNCDYDFNANVNFNLSECLTPLPSRDASSLFFQLNDQESRMNSISVLLVDDNPTFLRVTTQFLEAHDDVVVVGTADRGEKALSQAKDLQPQVVLIDLAMPGLTGLQTIPRLRRMLPDMGIIALTVMNTNGFRQAALAAGADIFVPKAAMRTDLMPAIRRVRSMGLDSPIPSLAPTPGNGSDKTSPGRVLVMEDDLHLRRLYVKALTASGYEVHPAATLQEARELVAQTSFDVLLCDIHMGEERATDLLEENATALFTSGAQVVMVSGQAHYRDVCEEMGADFFLEKPVAVGTLVALVDRLTARESFQPV